MRNKMNILLGISLLSILLNISIANESKCLRGHITILTEDGRKPNRAKIPILLEEEKKSPTTTDSNGFFCTSYEKNAGDSVILKLAKREKTGDPANKTRGEGWASWRIISPYNGKTNLPSKENHELLEVIIVPSSFYQSLLRALPPSSSLGKDCRNIDKIPHVQVLSSRDKKKAIEARKNLAMNGFQACVATRFVNNRKWHRVLVIADRFPPLEVCNTLIVHYGYECIEK